MCTRPSIPSSTSTNAPKSVMLRTLPVDDVADAVLRVDQVPGVGLGLLEARATAAAPSWSMSSTTHSTQSPTFRIFDGCLTRLVHDISETWIRPSTPSSTSTKAP